MGCQHRRNQRAVNSGALTAAAALLAAGPNATATTNDNLLPLGALASVPATVSPLPPPLPDADEPMNTYVLSDVLRDSDCCCQCAQTPVLFANYAATSCQWLVDGQSLIFDHVLAQRGLSLSDGGAQINVRRAMTARITLHLQATPCSGLPTISPVLNDVLLSPPLALAGCGTHTLDFVVPLAYSSRLRFAIQSGEVALQGQETLLAQLVIVAL